MYFPRIPTGLRWLLDSDTYGNDLSWFITVPEKVRFTELLLRAEFLGVSQMKFLAASDLCIHLTLYVWGSGLSLAS